MVYSVVVSRAISIDVFCFYCFPSYLCSTTLYSQKTWIDRVENSMFFSVYLQSILDLFLKPHFLSFTQIRSLLVMLYTSVSSLLFSKLFFVLHFVSKEYKLCHILLYLLLVFFSKFTFLLQLYIQKTPWIDLQHLQLLFLFFSSFVLQLCI